MLIMVGRLPNYKEIFWFIDLKKRSKYRDNQGSVYKVYKLRWLNNLYYMRSIYELFEHVRYVLLIDYQQ